MLWAIIFIVISIVISIKVMIDDSVGFGLFLLPPLLLLSILLGYLFGILTSAIIGNNTEFYTIQTGNDTIVPLSDSVGENGRYYLESGRTNSELYYFYMTATDQGLNVRKVEASRSYLNTSNDTPSIQTFERRYRSKFIELITVTTISPYYVINIPDESVKYNFEVDLK